MKVLQLEVQMLRDLRVRCSVEKQRENLNYTAPNRVLQHDSANIDGETIESNSDTPRAAGQNTDVQLRLTYFF